MSQLKTNEDSYRENKKKNLANILGEFYRDISWVWIKKGSRRKTTFQIDIKNRLGFFAERSHNLIEIDEDPLSEESISKLVPSLKNFLKNQEENLYTQITLTSFDNGVDAIFCAKRKLNFTQEQNLIKLAKEFDLNISTLVNKDFTPIFALKQNQIFYPDFKISLTSDIFIQATKEGLNNIVKIIRNELNKSSKVLDLYSGFGAYSFAISDLVKSVLAIEGDEKMTKLTVKNASENGLAQKIKAQTRDLYGDPLSARELSYFNVVIINPPRNGAETQIKQISKSQIKKVIYVSCNPISFLRDAKIMTNLGFKIKNLTAIDQFYNTSHLELVATFEK